MLLPHISQLGLSPRLAPVVMMATTAALSLGASNAAALPSAPQAFCAQ